MTDRSVNKRGRGRGDPGDGVAGTVFRVTPEELTPADEYEVSDYTRVRVCLRSGLPAWVYVQVDATG